MAGMLYELRLSLVVDALKLDAAAITLLD